MHILNKAQKVVWVLLPSSSGLSERAPSTKCLAMPHTFGNLFWASVPTHIVEQSGIMSPWQSHQGRKRTAPNAHFIWDLKCCITAASCPRCTCLSWSQMCSIRSVSVEPICLMEMYLPILNFYPSPLKNIYIIAYAVKNDLLCSSFLFAASLHFLL